MVHMEHDYLQGSFPPPSGPSKIQKSALLQSFKTDDPRIDHIGFVKLLGDGIELYSKKYELVIGRRSKSTNVDIVLGDLMNISRQHAKIVYNFQRACWELHVLGKNGVTVHGTLHTPTSPPVVLHSRDVIQIGERSFYFLLPKRSQWQRGHRGHSGATSAPPQQASEATGQNVHPGNGPSKQGEPVASAAAPNQQHGAAGDRDQYVPNGQHAQRAAMGSPVSPQEDHLPQPQHSLPQLSSSEPRQADIPQSPQPPQPSQVPSGPAQLQQMLSSPQQQAAQAMLSHQQQQQMLSSPQQHTLAAAAASGGPVLSPSVAQRLAAALPPSQQHAMLQQVLAAQQQLQQVAALSQSLPILLPGQPHLTPAQAHMMQQQSQAFSAQQQPLYANWAAQGQAPPGYMSHESQMQQAMLQQQQHQQGSAEEEPMSMDQDDGRS